MPSLENKSVLVTGGGRGLGAAICRELSRGGAWIAVADRDPATAQATADALEADGGKAIAVKADLVQDEHARGAIDAAVQAFGRLDVLVNNAGGVWGARLPGFPAEDWDALVGAHLRGAFLCAKHASAAMIAAGGGGKIINVASVFALFGPPGLAHYAAAKAGVLGLTRALAVELAPHGIQANCLVPGFFETELALGNTTPARRDEIRRRTPSGRWGSPEELVGAAVFLASRASDFVTGTTVVVDGGYTIAERLLHG